MKWIVVAALVIIAIAAFGWGLICSADPEGRADPMEVVGALAICVASLLGAVFASAHY